MLASQIKVINKSLANGQSQINKMLADQIKVINKSLANGQSQINKMLASQIKVINKSLANGQSQIKKMLALKLRWQCCTESTTTSLPLMELRTSYNHHHPTPPTSTTKTQPAVLAATLQNTVPAVLIPAKNHQRLEWPAPGSHWGQGHRHIVSRASRLQ